MEPTLPRGQKSIERLLVLMVILISVAAAAGQFLTAEPFDDIVGVIKGGAIWSAALLLWICCLQAVIVPTPGAQFSRPPKSRLLWLVPPFVCVLSVWCVSEDVPFRVKFRYSRPAFEQYSRQPAAASSTTVSQPRRIGAFDVEQIDQGPNCTTFILRSRTGRYFIRHDQAGSPFTPGEIDLGDGWSAGVVPVSSSCDASSPTKSFYRGDGRSSRNTQVHPYNPA